MTIEFNDEETRLLYNILLEQAAEHLTYANPSEIAERLYKLATRLERSVTTDSIHIA
jgi:transcriptional regulatory protein LevR